MNREVLDLLEYEGMKDLFRPHLMSELGGAALRELTPLDGEEDLRSRLDLVRECAAVLDRGGRLPLRGAGDLAGLLAKIHEKGRPLEPAELQLVADTLEVSRRLALTVAGYAAEWRDMSLPELASLVARIPGFTAVTDRIHAVVDERGRVRDEATARLAGLRTRSRTVRERIEKRIAGLLGRREVRGCLQEPRPRLRSGRMVLAVKAERRGEVRGVLHDVSHSGATCFVEPEAVVAEGNLLEDLLAQERREVTRILWETTVGVMEHEAGIHDALEAVALADLAQAAARTAAERGFCLPRIEPGGRFRFREARHPLLLLLLPREQVVPVDLRLGDDFDLLVITGPNTGGKTVTLKTMGILVLMAQSGLPVPAREAAFTPVREVFVDVGDEQSLEQSLSTFSSHVNRVARFLADSGRDTLMLLDELGSGTDPIEGAALGRAVLDYLNVRRVPTIVTTHLGHLKTYAFTHERASNASVEFDVQTLSPTYRLLLGQPGSSNALTIAERLGLPEEIVESARSYVGAGTRAGDEVLARAQEIRSRAEDQRREAESLRSKSEELHSRARAELEKAGERKRQAEREAEDELNEALARVRRLVKDFARQLGNAPNPFGPKAREFAERAEEEIRATPLGRRREEFASSLRKGDEVYVPRLKERFTVRQVKKKGRLLRLSRGGLEITVSFDDISWI